MQFTTLALSAFAATALGQSLDTVSVLNVLQTALPSSLVAEAFTNPGAVSSQIASQFLAGATPSWYSALPSDIQTYLVPAMPTNMPTGGLLGNNGTAMNGTATNGTMAGGNNSTSNGTATTSTRSRATVTEGPTSGAGSGSNSGSGSQSSDGAGFQGSSSSSESGNAAPQATAFAAGLGGVVAFVGLMAL